MFLLACICIHVEVLSHEDHSYYLSSFLATFRTSAQNWTFVHQFHMYSWENINAQFVSLKPWDDGLLTRSSVKVKRRMKSSSSLQRNEEFRVGSFTKSIHLFLRFLASGRSSLCKGIACSLYPSLLLGMQNIHQQHVYPAYFKFGSAKQVRNDRMLCRYDTGSTSQAS